jgi:Arc/MetJ-type ribon-helix-helix transcriptional regulator
VTADEESIMEKEFTTVSIPTSLVKKIEDAVRGTEDPSVANFVVRLLNEALAKNAAPEEVFSPEDEEKVKERLKALGYID